MRALRRTHARGSCEAIGAQFRPPAAPTARGGDRRGMARGSGPRGSTGRLGGPVPGAFERARSAAAKLAGAAALQVYITKTPTATATPFLARILRVRQKDPGFRGFRPTRSRLAQRRKRPPDHARDSFGISQKVRLPDRALQRRWSQSTQRDHIALARSQCHGTSFRPRATMTSSPRCHVTKICVNAAAPRC